MSENDQMRQVEIHIKGQMDKYRLNRFINIAVVHDQGGDTILTGSVRDQAELRGLINWLADLGLELTSVISERDKVHK